SRVAHEVEVRPRRAQADALHRNPEHTGDYLREGGLVPLPVVVRGREERELAVVGPAHFDLVLRREAGAGRLDVGGHPTAPQPPTLRRFLLPTFEPAPV